MNERSVICEQMLALLVMDLGYLSEPVYGHTPIRHQRAWGMCFKEIGAEGVASRVARMNEQAQSESKILAGMTMTDYSAAEMNSDIVVTKTDNT